MLNNYFPALENNQQEEEQNNIINEVPPEQEEGESQENIHKKTNTG